MKKNMKKMMMIMTIALVAAFLAAMFAPTFAAAPTTIEDAWFVFPMFVTSSVSTVKSSFTPDDIWTSDDGTVLHSRNTQISSYIAHTPDIYPPGTIRWGTFKAVSNFVFDTISNKGTLTMEITLTLTSATSNNPSKYPVAQYENNYGHGTLEGTIVADITSLSPDATTATGPIPGDGKGFFIATHGTGDFKNAKLQGDVTLRSGPSAVLPTGVITIEYIFFGHHSSYPSNDGALIFHHPGSSK
jgi:hypothetical protein